MLTFAFQARNWMMPAERFSDTQKSSFPQSRVTSTTSQNADMNSPGFGRLASMASMFLFPDTGLGFSCVPSNIELSSSNMPFPTATAWAEALAGLCKINGLWVVDLDDMVDGLLLAEQWVKENVREDYRDCLLESIRGMKRRMSGKYSEEQYLSRFHRKPRRSTSSIHR